jgi:SAM-dependent methyltransferase
MICKICGGNNFIREKVLWPQLCADWELSDHEADYINDQQGMRCEHCRCNLRSQALAQAILTSTNQECLFQDFTETQAGQNLKILEINPAGDLNPILAKLPNRTIIEYPEYNMIELNLPDDQYDMVIHSDTLEHIVDPKKGLMECKRILKTGGGCIFTVPVIVGRMSRSRVGMPPSYHGDSLRSAEDYRVFTEFGVDVWTSVFEAGFRSCKLHAINYPRAIAIEARK